MVFRTFAHALYPLPVLKHVPWMPILTLYYLLDKEVLWSSSQEGKESLVKWRARTQGAEESPTYALTRHASYGPHKDPRAPLSAPEIGQKRPGARSTYGRPVRGWIS
jgi:hypothetical protein